MKVVGCKVTDAKGKVNNIADGFRQDTFDSYVSIRVSFDQTLLAVGSFLRELVNREVQGLQRSVHVALCNATGGAQKSFVGAPEVVDRNLRLSVGHGRYDESA